MQNRLEDIGALFEFIRANPFHTPSNFKRYIVLPFESSDADIERKLQLLYDSLCLRRNKSILALPGVEERERKLKLSPAERRQYEHTKNVFDRTIRERHAEFHQTDKFGLFQAELQLRILCNHGTHQKMFSWTQRSLREAKEAYAMNVGLTAQRHCRVCSQLMPSHDFCRTFEGCGHFLCASCVEDADGDITINGNTTDQIGQQNHQNRKTKPCPLCRVDTRATTQPAVLGHLPKVQVGQDREALRQHKISDDYFREEGFSTKMEALVNDVKDGLEENRR